MNWRSRLHLLTLCSFAIAQPLYDVMGRYAEFLVAHRAGRWTIAAIVLALSLAIPLIVVAAVDLVRIINARAGRWAHRAAVALLVSLIAASALRTFAAAAALPLACLAGVAAAVAYRASAVRAFLTLASAAVLIFPLMFLLGTPVSRLMRAQRVQAADSGAGSRKPPIVLVVFDELSTFTLLDSQGNIDDRRFPNFAALARRATWFPNALSPFPQTEFAVPAIVTGVQPDASTNLLPIAQDHPDNLFTWLGSSYRMHVAEPVTQLCPPAVCPEGDTARNRQADSLIADLGILYLHLITPREIAERKLPSVGFAWKGFAAPPPQKPAQPVKVATPQAHDWDMLAAFGRAMPEGRAELFRRFIRDITADGRPALHYAHVLLPHQPYEYLSSGTMYPHANLTGGETPAGMWTGERPLVETARLRHDEQSRFVDALVGELVAQLEAEGLLDETLLIVTSDHGAAFIPADWHRWLTRTTYPEIIAVPMFVKLPGQQAGRIDQRRMSGLDVVPTVADVLGARLPWCTDGVSVVHGDVPTRSTIVYPGRDVPPLPTFDVREEKRKADGVLAPAATEPADDPLVGRSIAELNVQPDAPGLQVFSENFRAFESVSPEKGIVPALVQGRIEYSVPAREPIQIAIAVNDVVRAVTRTVRDGSSPHYFAALVQASSFRPGANRLEILKIDRSGADTRLVRISSELSAGLRLRADSSGVHLATGAGKDMPLDSRIGGVIDAIEGDPDGLMLRGWAVDRRNGNRLRSVVAFVDELPVSFAVPDGKRPDVAAALNAAASTDVAFALHVSRAYLVSENLRLFGVAGDNTAGELQLSDQNRQALSQLVRGPAEK